MIKVTVTFANKPDPARYYAAIATIYGNRNKAKYEAKEKPPCGNRTAADENYHLLYSR